MIGKRHPVWAAPKMSTFDRVLGILSRVAQILLALSIIILSWTLWKFLGPPPIDTVTVLIMGTVLAAVLVYSLPKLQVRFVSFSSPAERFGAENEARKTVATAAAGLAIFLSFYIAQKQLAVQQQGQFTDMYTSAIRELTSSDNNGAPKLDVRLGGIYAMEQIMNSSAQYHFPIMEVLCSYVRENSLQSTLKPKNGPRADVQVALTVLGRRNRDFEVAQARKEPGRLIKALFVDRNFLDALTVQAVRPHLDFSGSDLRGADLSSLILAGADFSGARLSDCKAMLADLQGANFDRADLSSCLIASRLTGVSFAGANLQGAVVSGTVDKGALDNADIGLSCWVGAKFQDPKSVKEAKNWQTAFYSDRDLAALGLPPDHNLKLVRSIRSRYPTFLPEIKLLIGNWFGLLRKQAGMAEDIQRELAKPLPSAGGHAKPGS